MTSISKSAAWLRSSALPRAGLLTVIKLVPLALLLMGIAVFVAYLGGVYNSELGFEDSDEPAHFVTGLLIHDYLVKLIPEPPLPFAVRYYLHYPKIALGVWPPLFHVLEALWMAIFTPQSVFFFSAAITAAAAVALFSFVRRQLGAGYGVLAAMMYVLLPPIQASTASVMVDGLVAALDLIAVILFTRYIETEARPSAYAFGCLAALGALSKANALALIPFPFIALAISGSLYLFRRREVWIALLIIIVTTAPWNYVLFRILSNWVAPTQSSALAVLKRGSISFQFLVSTLGVLLPFALIGIWQHVIRPLRTRSVRPVYASAFALILSVYGFHAVIPTTDAPTRYLLPCLAALLVFVMAGIEWIAHALPGHSLTLQQRRVALGAVALFGFFAFEFHLVQRGHSGFFPVAERLANEPVSRVILVSGDAPREGMVVAEVAIRDKRPRHYILRGSKVLARSDWFGKGYRPLFATPEEVSKYLDSVPVDFVLIDTRRAQATPHDLLLARTLNKHSEIWRRAPDSSGRLQLWERIHPLQHGEPRISVDMKSTISGTLSSGEEGR